MVEEAVSQDVEHHTWLCATEEFLEKFLGCQLGDEKVRAILKKLPPEVYTSKGGWQGLPAEAGGPEKPYYKPLTLILNAIVEAARNLGFIGADAIQCRWLDRHSVAPKSNTMDASKIRPDILDAILGPDGPDVAKEFMKSAYDAEREQLKAEEGEETDLNRATKRPRTDTEENTAPPPTAHIASWIRTLLPVEVKPKGGDVWDVVKQLCTYFRQILREQHDRRFVLGLIFLHRSLCLWYCDRSGILGTATLIDIDENPELLVRVIASFAMMTPERLGFDPNMKLSVEGHLPSFSYNMSYVNIPKLRSQLHWRILISGQWYQTVEALSTARSEVMCGRAPVVWRAFRIDDPNRELVIIKQSWRPHMGEKSEGEIYELLGDFGRGEPRVISEDVERSNTQLHFRGKIDRFEPDGTPAFDNHTKRQRPLPEPTDENCLVHRTFNLKSLRKVPAKPHKFMERVQCRLVIPVNGLPLKMAVSSKDLLSALEGILEDYEYAYLMKGVCHRDLSIGNLVIQVVSGKRRGRLIDFDHSKVLDSFVRERASSLREELSEELDEFHFLTAHKKCPKATDNLALLLLDLTRREGGKIRVMVYNAVAAYCTLCSSLKPNRGSGPVAPSELLPWLDDDPVLPPRFEKRKVVHSFVTGTDAFISHRLLRDGAETHIAIHDMESLLWVVLYIFLTREGFGGKPRPDPRDDISHMAAIRRYWLFEASKHEIKDIKSQLFSLAYGSDPQLFDTEIHPFVHPSFKPLAPLVDDWWNILCKAFHPEDTDLLYKYYPVAAFRQSVRNLKDSLPASDPSAAEGLLDQQLKAMAKLHELAARLTRDVEVESSTTPPTASAQLPAAPLDQTPPAKKKGVEKWNVGQQSTDPLPTLEFS
ncbi:other/FunK1 protein kinase [Coprinopsis cinerea AmutBmut pab1-1]|nr:other/FunK1 protein kinase [Coprinopsis cinerea AmutBmut pab1-1]